MRHILKRPIKHETMIFTRIDVDNPKRLLICKV